MAGSSAAPCRIQVQHVNQLTQPAIALTIKAKGYPVEVRGRGLITLHIERSWEPLDVPGYDDVPELPVEPREELISYRMIQPDDL